ncbi:MAG: hypothetical protein K6B72_07245 [Lachnospiraceae bacterium]|jgi:hypothetical protein|nr:hypothetical protein [Lachnospiraceae bacterium]
MKKAQLIVLGAMILLIAVAAVRLYLWNRGSVPDAEETAADEADLDVEILDQVYRLSGDDLAGKKDDGKETILCLGGDAFAWNYDEGLVRSIAEATGADVVNAAFLGSRVTVSSDKLDLSAHPEDVFCFYHIASDIAKGDFSDLEEAAHDRWEEDYSYQTSLDHLKEVDYAALDTILINYGAADYFAERSCYNPDEDKMFTDLKTVTGSYASGIRLIREALPHVRIVLLTPSLVYTYTTEGKPVEADRLDRGHGTLITYIEFALRLGEACGVTVIDNYHGMASEDTFADYMADTEHFSPAGNAQVAAHVARVLRE